MNTAILKTFDAVTQELLELLSPLSDTALNKIPFENSWTAGQLGDHLYKSYNVIGLLNGRVKDTERSPDQKLKEIRKQFLDFSIKMESPKAVLPTENPINKQELLKGLKDRIEQQREVIINKNLSKTCLDFEITGYGPFTRLEWIGFNTVHTQRHLHQLKNILVNLNILMPMRSDKLILDFKDAFDREPWYGDSVMKKLNTINLDIANVRPLPSFNSIAEIIQHMINWRIFAIKKMQGDKGFDIRQNYANDWTEANISSQSDWDELIKKLQSSQKEIIKLLSVKNEDFLDLKVSGRDYDFAFLLAGILQHDIYHLGQIALVVKWCNHQSSSSNALS